MELPGLALALLTGPGGLSFLLLHKHFFLIFFLAYVLLTVYCLKCLEFQRNCSRVHFDRGYVEGSEVLESLFAVHCPA